MNESPNLLFFGAGRFSRICFEAFLKRAQKNFGKITVVVPPSNGDNTDLANTANKLDLEIQTAPPKSLKDWSPSGGPWDFGAVASFSYFLPAPLIDSFRLGIVNAHPSLLPKYRGAAPIQRSMIDDYAKGISIIGLDKQKFDAGTIYLSEYTSFQPRYDHEDYEPPENLYYSCMEERLAEHCGIALSKVLLNWKEYSKEAVEQSGLSTLAPKITKADAFVSFKNQGGKEIHRRYQAIGHQETLRAILKPSGIVVYLLDIYRDNDWNSRPDRLKRCHNGVNFDGYNLWISCADGRWIRVSKFRVEGKSNTFSAKEFYHNFILRNPVQYFE